MPTPRGEALLPRLDDALAAIGALVGEPTRRQRFTVACVDGLSHMLLPRIAARLAVEQPHVQLRAVTLERLIATDGLEQGSVDLLVGLPPTVPASHRVRPLFTDRYVVLVDRANARVGRRLNLSTYAALPHAELALFGEPDDVNDRAFAAKGRTRRVAVASPHISSLPLLVHGSERVATLFASAARALAKPLGLRLLRPPLPLPTAEMRMCWHRRTDADPSSQAFRALVAEVAAPLGR